MALESLYTGINEKLKTISPLAARAAKFSKSIYFSYVPFTIFFSLSGHPSYKLLENSNSDSFKLQVEVGCIEIHNN